jgi:Sulfotransferase domain
MRPIALWATPRTVSTAFDKMIRARGDLEVLTEPFSRPYNDGPEQRSTRFPVTEPQADFETTLAEVVGGDRPRFVKEMAYQLGPLLRADVLARFTSSFLVRDPAWAIPSLLRVWPDATIEEAGYRAQLEAFDLATEVQGAPPPVLDSDDLRRDPDGVVERWCAAVGIEHRPEALRWEPGMPADWGRWGSWFEAAAASTGFAPPSDAPPPPLTGRAADLVERCRPAYDAMVGHRL